MQDLAQVYGAVIDDVCTKVRSEFIQEGNEPVLEELRSLWEEKLLQTGILDNIEQQNEDKEPIVKPDFGEVPAQQGFANHPAYSAQRFPAYQQPVLNLNSSQYLQPVHPLQQPLHGHAPPQQTGLHAFGQPQAHMPSQQAVHRPVHGSMHPVQSGSHLASTHPSLPPAGQYSYGHVQSQQWPQNNATDSRKRKADTLQVPYGAVSAGPPEKQERLSGTVEGQPGPSGSAHAVAHPAQAIPQQDGPADAPAVAPTDTEDGSLDNLSDVEVEDGDVDQKMLPDFILGQYENVKRIKNRWRCSLNHAVMHLNGQDVVVTKASGEFTF